MTAFPQKISVEVLAVCPDTLSIWKNYLSALQELSKYRAVLQPCCVTDLFSSSDLASYMWELKICSLKQSEVFKVGVGLFSQATS